MHFLHGFRLTVAAVHDCCGFEDSTTAFFSLWLEFCIQPAIETDFSRRKSVKRLDQNADHLLKKCMSQWRKSSTDVLDEKRSDLMNCNHTHQGVNRPSRIQKPQFLSPVGVTPTRVLRHRRHTRLDLFREFEIRPQDWERALWELHLGPLTRQQRRNQTNKRKLLSKQSCGGSAVGKTNEKSQLL